MPFIVGPIMAIGSAIASAGVAVAAAVGTALGGGALGAAVANGIVTLTGGAGVMAAASAWSTASLLASSALTRPPSIGASAAGTQVEFKADPNAPIPLVLGRTGTGGSIVHATVGQHNTKQTHLAYRVVLSAGPIEGVEKLAVNGEPIAFVNEAATVPPYTNAMWWRPDVGAQPSTFWEYPAPPGMFPEWTAEHTISGLAGGWWILYYLQGTYPTGVPEPVWTVLGPAVYDPRKDDTYPGGSGPQRWNNEATWSFEGRDNPYLQALTWLIGRRWNGKLVLGVGAPIDAIDVASYVEGANVAEENGWTVGGVVTSADRKWDVLRAILQAGGGRPSRLGARISCVVSAPRVALNVGDPWTGDDLVGQARVTATQPRRERINCIVPRYRSEAHGWKVIPLAPVEVEAYVEADGGRRSREVEYPLVQASEQAAQLAAYDIVDARELGPIVLPSKPRFAHYKPGDCILVDEPDIGLVNRKVLILQRTRDLQTGVVTLTCRTETDGKHEFALGRTDVPPLTPGLDGVDTSAPIPSEGSWVATAAYLEGADGSRVPIILIVGSVDDPRVGTVIAETRLAETETWVAEGEQPPSVTRIEVRGVTPEATYDVRIRYRSVRGVEDPDRVLDLGQVTVGPLIASRAEALGEITVPQMTDVLAKWEAFIRRLTELEEATTSQVEAAWDRIKARLDELGVVPDVLSGAVIERALAQRDAREYQNALSYDENGVPLKERQLAFEAQTGQALATIYQNYYTSADVDQAFANFEVSITSQYEGAIAAATSDLVTLADMTSAISAATTSLEATFADNIASATSSLASYSDVSSAISSYNTGLQASVSGGLTARVNAHITAIANLQDEVYGAYTLSVEAGGVVAGMKLLAAGGTTPTSQVIFSADAFRIRAPGAGSDLQFSYDAVAGELYSPGLTIRRGNIQGAAIATFVGVDATILQVIGSSFTDIGPPLSINAGSGGAKIALTCFLYAENSDPANGQDVTVAIYKDGSFLKQKIFHINLENQGHITWMCLDEAVGGHVYQVKAKSVPGTGNHCRATEVFLEANILFNTGPGT